MRALAAIPSAKESERVRHTQVAPVPFFIRSSSSLPLVQRKSSCACGGGCPDCQSHSGKISKPGDASERQADSMAERVMRKASGVPLTSAGTLSTSGRQVFEAEFGHDLSQVRLHTDSAAAQSARSLNAAAYTFGNDIVFGKGQFAPETSAGRQLLAHELSHVVQQRVSGTPYIQRQWPSPDCNGQSMDPKTQCCVNGNLLPRHPVDDLDSCPDRVQSREPHVYDGCSAIWLPEVKRNNPAGGKDTWFSDRSIHGTEKTPGAITPLLPCDVHDKCYQTCSTDPHAKEKCDQELFASAREICSASSEGNEIKDKCYAFVDEAEQAFAFGSFAAASWLFYYEDQEKYCDCCPDWSFDPQKPLLPGSQDWKTVNTENTFLVQNPYDWEKDANRERLPVGTRVLVIDKGKKEKFNKTSEKYKWWRVQTSDGRIGWVMKALLD